MNIPTTAYQFETGEGAVDARKLTIEELRAWRDAAGNAGDQEAYFVVSELLDHRWYQDEEAFIRDYFPDSTSDRLHDFADMFHGRRPSFKRLEGIEAGTQEWLDLWCELTTQTRQNDPRWWPTYTDAHHLETWLWMDADDE